MMPVAQFVPARFYARGPRAAVDWIVLHTAEVGQVRGVAENVAHGFKRGTRLVGGIEVDNKVSAHYVVDDDALFQCVSESAIAWHAPPNARSIGIELCGHAAMTPDQWAAPFSASMLAIAAELVAGICARWNIPVQMVPRQGLLAGVRGITTHAEVSAAWHESDHTDPGAGFPFGDFLAAVARASEPPPLAAA